MLTTPTTGDVTWTTTLAPTGPGAASGSFAFGKTVYASEGTAGVGELSDKATLTPANSKALTAEAVVDLDATATGPQVRIRKTVDIAPWLMRPSRSPSTRWARVGSSQEPR